jgi:hypothetical protein
MKKQLVVMEETGTGYSAYFDLPGCGATRAAGERNIGRTLSFLLQAPGGDSELVPELHTCSAYVELPARAETDVFVKNLEFLFSNLDTFYR